ncbi:uncharacterized protein DMENIID0001_025950 [Sergentomyia squamirostris]
MQVSEQVDDPPYLSVGTEVSAKYKGAFCEAKVRKVVRNIKCKVAFKLGLGSGTVSDDQIKGGLLRVGATVEVKHPERREFVEATITKIQDCSQYTVVFDDGDITTLRRSALCLKSGRHFNESETLDQLPLTHPEHFGNPVVGGRRGRRSRQMQDDSSDEEEDVESTKRRPHEKEEHIGKVVCVENNDTKKKSQKESWFPGLVVAPTAQDTVRIRVKDEYLVRSFKDGRYYTVPKKEATQFTREHAKNQEGVAIQAALEYLDSDTLPPHWDRDVLFGLSASSSDYEQEFDSDSSDDEPREEKDHFVAQLYKYMDDRGTPLNKGPSIVNRDIDLYRLFRAAQKLGGYNRVTSQNQWKAIALRLGFVPATTSIMNLVKQAYKKFLQPFEEFNRKLGCTMVAHPRANRIKGRSLVRANSVASPKPADGKETKSVSSTATDEYDNSESSSEPVKTKRKLSTNSGNGGSAAKIKAAIVAATEKVEEEKKKEEEPEVIPIKERVTPKGKTPKPEKEPKEDVSSVKMIKTKEEPIKSEPPTPSSSKKEKPASKVGKSDEKRGRKKKETEPGDKIEAKEVKPDGKKTSESSTAIDDFPVEVGDKLNVYYHEETVTYEAKVIEKSMQNGNPIFLVHYTGWNTRYDEWVPKDRIVENLTNKQKRTKPAGAIKTVVTPPTSMPPTKSAAKRGRGGSRSDSQPPRSTTPSSITSNSSRTKSPATPAQRRTTRAQPQNIRRTSNNTDISSLHTESDTDSDEPVKKPTRTSSSFTIPSKTGGSTVSQLPEAIVPVVAMRSVAKEIQAMKDEEEATKGRDYDLNQIRSEMKGLKEMKSPSPETAEQSPTSSSHHDHKTSLFDLSDSNTDSSEQKSDLAKGKLTSTTSSSECDSFGDDDSQSSDKLARLEKPPMPSKAEKVTKKQTASEKKEKPDLTLDKSVTKVAVSLEKMETSKAFTGKAQFKASLAEKKKEEKAAKAAETPAKKTGAAKGEKTPAGKGEKKTGEKTKTGATPKAERAAKKIQQEKPSSAKDVPSEGDIYEFKEPEPFEFETAGGAGRKPGNPTPEAGAPNPPEKKGKKSRQSAEDGEAPSPVTKKTKKTPAKPAPEAEKPKPAKKDDNLDTLIPCHLIPIPNVKQSPTQPPVTTAPSLSSDPFDALRKSPCFNLTNTLSSSVPETAVSAPQPEPSTSKLPTFIDDKFIKTCPDVKRPLESFKSPAFVNSFTNVLDAPCQFGGTIKDVFKGTEDDKTRIDTSKDLETAKKMFLTAESPFDMVEPPKIDGPSIADKILMKSLNTQPLVTDVKAEELTQAVLTASLKAEPPKNDILPPPPPAPAPVKFEIPPVIAKKEVEVVIHSKTKVKAVLASAETNKIDLDMPPKNNDLCETIQKLESAIQKSSNLNRFTEDSSDSTDSEQRLVIEDESHSSETVHLKEAEKKDTLHVKSDKALVVPPLKVDSITLKEESMSFATKFQESLYGIKSPEHTSTSKIQAREGPDSLATMKSPPGGDPDVKPDLTCKESFDDFFAEKKEAPPEGVQMNEAMSLLCDETIPCSPVASGHLRDVTGGESAKRIPHPITADIKPIPMDIETSDVKAEPQQTPNSSPRDSISPDDRIEDSTTQKKRRRVRKSSESETTAPKRRKPGTRRNATSTTNGSDSDDNSDPNTSHRTHIRRSPKPCQYNFLVQLDPALNSSQRIAILKKKIQELRKTYNQIKAELASIDRRRKKLRRRERENKKNQQKAAAT